MRSRSAAFVGGVLADAALGDPPNALHPVVLIGRVAALARRFTPGDAWTRRRYGVAMALRVNATEAHLGATIEQLANQRPPAINLRWALEEMRQALRGRKSRETDG